MRRRKRRSTRLASTRITDGPRLRPSSRRPIIGLAHRDGDTWSLLDDEWRVPYLADMNTPEAIAQTLLRFFGDITAGQAYVPPASLVADHSRRARCMDLAALLDEITPDPAVVTGRQASAR